MSWFKRHKGWTTMFILTAISFLWDITTGASSALVMGNIWALYLIAWAIWGRKRSW